MAGLLLKHEVEYFGLSGQLATVSIESYDIHI